MLRLSFLKKLSKQALAVFLLTLIFCSILAFALIRDRVQIERLTMEQLFLEKSAKISDTLSSLLMRTQSLSLLIQHYGGNLSAFEQFASILLIDEPAILNFLAAPGGIVSHIYPLEGNEELLGLDFFYEEVIAADTELYETFLLAAIAKDTRELVMGGPFISIQGVEILAGRQAVFLEDEYGMEFFWGIAGISLKYPYTLEGAGLNKLRILGFDYEIWRINPFNNERQVIIRSPDSQQLRNPAYVDIPVTIMNAQWYFRALTTRTWYLFPGTWLLIVGSIIVSIMAATVMQNYQELKVLKNKLEMLSITDPLTGIRNRRYFMEFVPKQMERVIRQNNESFIIMYDLDHFKSVNDTYGHQSGDMVLKESAVRAAAMLRPYDVFARYGGEEFVIFVSGLNKEAVVRLAERIRLNIAETQIEVKNASVTITASFGIAAAAPKNELDDAIALVDKALYQAKENGRNRVVFL